MSIQNPVVNSTRMMWFSLLLFAGFGLVADVRHTFEQGGIDFRNRLIGARLILSGQDPYFYKWKESDPLAWLDPRDSPTMPVNRNTVSPACLVLYAPLAPLTYRLARCAWLLVQWSAYAGLAGLLVTSVTARADRRALLAVFLLAFAGEAWRVHVERGQVYIVYALLLAISYRLTRDKPGLGGLVLGLVIGLRPTFLVAALPFLLARCGRFLAGTIGGIAVALAASLTVADMDDWSSYFRAMDTIVTASVDGLDSDRLSTKPAPAIPATIEGCDNLSDALRFAHPETGFARIVRFLGIPHGRAVLQGALFVYLVVMCLGIRGCWNRSVSLGVLFFTGVVMAVSCELFLPAHRGGYSNILWLVPTGILVAERGVNFTFQSRLVWLLMLGLLLALGVMPSGRGDYISASDTVLLVYFSMMALRLASTDSRRVIPESVDGSDHRQEFSSLSSAEPGTP
jgi:hypothetical protein